MTFPGIRYLASRIFGLGVAALAAGLTAPAHAEPWGKLGFWLLAGSPAQNGCTMATRYPDGAFLSLTVVADRDGTETWELLISDHEWSHVLPDHQHQVHIHFLGAKTPAVVVPMQGYTSDNAPSIISNALVLKFTARSETMAYVAHGMSRASRIALTENQSFLGSFDLDQGALAFDELRKCFVARGRSLDV